MSAFIIHIIGIFILQIHPLLYLLAPVASGIAIIVAKKKLTKLENIALDKAELGKIHSSLNEYEKKH